MINVVDVRQMILIIIVLLLFTVSERFNSVTQVDMVYTFLQAHAAINEIYRTLYLEIYRSYILDVFNIHIYYYFLKFTFPLKSWDSIRGWPPVSFWG